MKMPSSLEKRQQHESLQFLRMVLLKTVQISGIMVILLAGRLNAQVLYGGLVGNVTDPSGAVVPNAEVRARNLDTGAVLQTTTGTTGNFAIGNVPPGRFEVTINKRGLWHLQGPECLGLDEYSGSCRCGLASRQYQRHDYCFYSGCTATDRQRRRARCHRQQVVSGFCRSRPERIKGWLGL